MPSDSAGTAGASAAKPSTQPPSAAGPPPKIVPNPATTLDDDNCVTVKLRGAGTDYKWRLLTPAEEANNTALKPFLGPSKAGVDFESPLETQLFDSYHNGDPAAEVGRINRAIANCKLQTRPKAPPATEAEWRQFRKMLLLGKMHPARGVEGLFATAKRGVRDPPNFQKYLPKNRFKHIYRFCAYAFADDESIKMAPQIESGTTATFGMAHHRHVNQQGRKLTVERCQRVIADEKMMKHIPRTTPDGGNPHTTYEERKPEKIGLLTVNAADPEQWTELAQEERAHPDVQAALEFGDRCQPHVAASLRIMKKAGASKDNDDNFFGDAWFPSVGLVEAVEVEFPGWTVTGMMKNNSAGFPVGFLDELCVSRHNKIVKAGHNKFMLGWTRSGKTAMMACAHKYTEKSTKLLLTTAGDCSLGKHHTQMFNDTDGVRKRSNPVERPQVHCEFFGTAGVIDHVNSQTGHELRLYQEWPAKTFWKKLFVYHEGCVLADMYLQHRENKVLESMQETGRTETIVEFPDRLLLSIKPIKRSGLGVPASPAPGTPVSSPVSPRRSVMPGMIRGKRRSNVLDDGDHCHCRGSPTKVVRRTTSATGTWQKVQRKSCLVCKAQGTRMNDKNNNFPQTQSQCGHCHGFVHGPNEPGYPNCWNYHLHNSVAGLTNSGDMASGQAAGAAAGGWTDSD